MLKLWCSQILLGGLMKTKHICSTTTISHFSIFLYRIIEIANGERKSFPRIVPYKYAQAIKVCLMILI